MITYTSRVTLELEHVLKQSNISSATEDLESYVDIIMSHEHKMFDIRGIHLGGIHQTGN